MIIGVIAEHDFPEGTLILNIEWPDLLNNLIITLNKSSPKDPQTYGSITCLSIIVENFSENLIKKILPKLLPIMNQIIQNKEVNKL
jgi:hypothetical protein